MAKERVTISAQAPTIVQLYATGILAPIGSRAIALEVDGQDLGEWVLERWSPARRRLSTT